MHMHRLLAAVLGAIILGTPAMAAVEAFPAGFQRQMVTTNGASLYVRVGGQGPAVVLLHGFGDTGDMWAPLAARLAKNHTVIVPDLRGMGLSAHPHTGYTKKNQALDTIRRSLAVGPRLDSRTEKSRHSAASHGLRVT